MLHFPAYQSNFFRSYHKFLHKSWSNFVFRISTKHQLNLNFKILIKPSFRISTKIKLHNLNQESAAKYWPNLTLNMYLKWNTYIFELSRNLLWALRCLNALSLTFLSWEIYDIKTVQNQKMMRMRKMTIISWQRWLWLPSYLLQMMGTRALISSISLFSRSRRIFSALFRSSRDELQKKVKMMQNYIGAAEIFHFYIDMHF